MPVPIIILLLTLTAVAARKFIPFKLPIWSIMTIGAILVLLLGQISISHAVSAIDPDVILYLLGFFFICQAAEESGFLEQFTEKLFCRAKTGSHALLLIVFVLGLASALFMNDTIAIVGTPIILQLCRSHKHLIKPL